MIWQDVPFQVPRLNPMVTVESGARAISVAVTVPALLTVKGWVWAPLTVTVSEYDSVIVGTSVVGGVVGLLLPQAAAPSASRTLPRTVKLGMNRCIRRRISWHRQRGKNHLTWREMVE